MRDLHDEDAIASAADEYHDSIGGNASGLCPPPFMVFCPFKMVITANTFTIVFWSQFLLQRQR